MPGRKMNQRISRGAMKPAKRAHADINEASQTPAQDANTPQEVSTRSIRSSTNASSGASTSRGQACIPLKKRKINLTAADLPACRVVLPRIENEVILASVLSLLDAEIPAASDLAPSEAPQNSSEHQRSIDQGPSSYPTRNPDLESVFPALPLTPSSTTTDNVRPSAIAPAEKEKRRARRERNVTRTESTLSQPGPSGGKKRAGEPNRPLPPPDDVRRFRSGDDEDTVPVPQNLTTPQQQRRREIQEAEESRSSGERPSVMTTTQNQPIQSGAQKKMLATVSLEDRGSYSMTIELKRFNEEMTDIGNNMWDILLPPSNRARIEGLVTTEHTTDNVRWVKLKINRVAHQPASPDEEPHSSTAAGAGSEESENSEAQSAQSAADEPEEDAPQRDAPEGDAPEENEPEGNAPEEGEPETDEPERDEHQGDDAENKQPEGEPVEGEQSAEEQAEGEQAESNEGEEEQNEGDGAAAEGSEREPRGYEFIYEDVSDDSGSEHDEESGDDEDLQPPTVPPFLIDEGDSDDDNLIIDE